LSEVVVQRYEDEVEAETAAGLLRSQGIEARVRYQATSGYPRQVAPIRVIAPLGGFELLVSDADVDRAVEALDEAGPPSERPKRFRWLGIALLILFAGPLLIQFIASALDAF
jgi:hypothetical protein